jgi:hypothetical protein
MLDLNRVSRCRHRSRSQRAPPGGHPVPSQQGIGLCCYDYAHQVLQCDDEQQAMSGLQDQQKKGISDWPDKVRRRVHGSLEVGQAVGKAERGWVRQQRDSPYRGSRE